MGASVSLGRAMSLVLEKAILVYRDEFSRKAHLTIHDAVRDASGGMGLGPAAPPSHAFVDTLARQLFTEISQVCWVSENIVATTPGMVAWWRPASTRPLFFNTTSEEINTLSGRTFPVPPLLFRAKVGDGRVLHVRALLHDRRPTPDDTLAAAPFLNVSAADGNVCMGSAINPDKATPDTISDWEDGWWGSAFSHTYGGGPTTHPAGMTGLILDTVGKPSFPMGLLQHTPQTASQFVRNISA